MDVTGHDDPESVDAGPLDLTPRAATATPRSRPGVRKFVPWVAAGVVVVAIGLVAVTLFGSATYFYNVDDAVAKQADIGDKRIRLQGNILKGSIDEGEQGVAFTLSYGGAEVRVDHTGDVPDLFGPTIPVVVEGRFTSDESFDSDRILVKHDETYDEDNGDRIRDAEKDADSNAASTPVETP